MPDKKDNPIEVLEHAKQGNRRQLGDEQLETAVTLAELSDEELKQQLLQRGFEMRKNRRPKMVYAREDNVRGKTKISVHLPTDLRKMVKRASTETGESESTIATQAFRLWLQHQQLGGGHLKALQETAEE